MPEKNRWKTKMSKPFSIPMNAIRCLLALLLMQTLCLARETAYEALRQLSAQHGPKSLEQVLELRGSQGAPQPLTWKVLLSDPLARGGVRQFEIAQGKILSEKTPVSAGVDDGATVDFQKLNLDSSGAFTLAEEEARKRKHGFDSVDYLLRRGTSGPEWILYLMAEGKGNIGTLHIAADSGSILLVEGFQTPLEEPAPDKMKERTEAVRRSLTKFGNNVRDGFQRTGESMRRFFDSLR